MIRAICLYVLGLLAFLLAYLICGVIFLVIIIQGRNYLIQKQRYNQSQLALAGGPVYPVHFGYQGPYTPGPPAYLATQAGHPPPQYTTSDGTDGYQPQYPAAYGTIMDPKPNQDN